MSGRLLLWQVIRTELHYTVEVRSEADHGRRPDLRLPADVQTALRKAIDDHGGLLVLKIEDVPAPLKLHGSYADEKRAPVLANSLSRRLPGIKVGVRGRGKMLSFTIRE